MGRIIRVAAALAAGLVMLAKPQAVLEGAARGCALWAQTVMPGLLPFMICLLYATGNWPLASRSSRFNWLSRLTGLGRAGNLLGLMGWMTGSPGGARLMAEGLRRGLIVRREALRLSVYIGVMSPMFVLGALAGWTGVPGAGWRLLAAHWLGALAAGQLSRLVPEKEWAAPPAEEASPRGMTLPQAVQGACTAMITVAGCMAMGCAAAEIMAALWPGLDPKIAALAQCLMEVTAGGRAMLAAGYPPWCLAGAVSLGGLSLWLQNMAFFPQGVDVKWAALGRLIACGVSLAAARLLWPEEAMVFASSAAAQPASPLPVAVFGLLTLWSFCKAR